MPSVCAVALSALTAVALPAQALPAGPAPADAALADSLRSFAVTMGNRFHARDAEGVIAMYGDSATYVHINNGVVASYAQVTRNLRAGFAGPGTNPVWFVGEPRVVLLDANTAVVYYAMRIDAVGGRSAQEGMWTGVLRRGAEGWRIAHSHASTHPTPP
jgi:ketosteroid isomerase-like protein